MNDVIDYLKKQKPYGKPSKTTGVENGDLVRVIYLPVSMSHFNKLTGVVRRRDKNGDFFIAPLGRNRRPVETHATGWYSPENVEVLLKGYEITTVSYTRIPPNIERFL